MISRTQWNLLVDCNYADDRIGHHPVRTVIEPLIAAGYVSAAEPSYTVGLGYRVRITDKGLALLHRATGPETPPVSREPAIADALTMQRQIIATGDVAGVLLSYKNAWSEQRYASAFDAWEGLPRHDVG
jgi:hypothetical protein